MTKYKINKYVGYGRYVTKYLTKSEMITYLKRWNPTNSKRELLKKLKNHEVKKK